MSFSVRHGEKQEEQSSQICSCSIVLFKSYNQLHLTFAISCVTCLKIISWITLDYPSAVKSGHVWQNNARRNARAVKWEGAGLKHNARCGLVAGMKVIGQVFLPRETYTVHYTVKRKVCAGLKPIWLVQVWRQRDLESIVLDLRVRTYPSISAFTQKDWNPPTLFFNITSSGPYPWSILTDQSSFIVLCHCYANRDDIRKLREIWPGKPALALSSEEDTRQQDKQLIESYLSWMSIPETSFHAEKGKGSTWTNVEGK